MYIDLFIVVVLLWSAWTGWHNGFLKEIISSVGFFAGLLVAALCYSTLGKYLAVDGSESNMLTSVVAFFILWIMVPMLLGLGATLLTKALKGMKLGLPNSLLGAAVAVLKYGVLMCVVFSVMDALGIMDERRARSSRLYGALRGAMVDAADCLGSDDSRRLAPERSAGQESDTVWIENPAAR